MIDFLQNATPEELQASIALRDRGFFSHAEKTFDVLCDNEPIGYVSLILWGDSNLHWTQFRPFEYVRIGHPLKQFLGKGVGTLVHALTLKEYEQVSDDLLVTHGTVVSGDRQRHLLSMGMVWPTGYRFSDHQARCYRAAALRGFDFPMLPLSEEGYTSQVRAKIAKQVGTNSPFPEGPELPITPHETAAYLRTAHGQNKMRFLNLNHPPLCLQETTTEDR